MTLNFAERTAIIVVAAGSGTRLGAGVPKALAQVAGESILSHALRVAVDPELAVRVVVVTPPGDRRLDAIIEAAQRPGVELVSVEGGQTRQESVSIGLLHTAPARWVLVHDAARALTSKDQYQRVQGALSQGAVAAVPGLKVVDTLKQVDRQERVTSTPDRSRLRAVQTPQGFDAALLRRAHAAAGDCAATDDAALMERNGSMVQVVQGEERALKITHPADIAWAERWLMEHAGAPRAGASLTGISQTEPLPAQPQDPQPQPARVVLPRVGLGIDVHAFTDDPAQPLWLAGLHFPGERGLSGHSDGDAVAHAACDALFSAAGVGDLGTHFGTDRPEYAGASGATLLAVACQVVRSAGFEIGNISIQFVGNRPKFAGRREEADRVLSAVVGAPVSVIATTSDGLGFEGKGQGISARAVALLVPAAR